MDETEILYEQNDFMNVNRDLIERLLNTVELAPVGLAHIAPNGSWLWVNQCLCDILGYARDELQRMTFQDITFPEDLQLDLNYIDRMLSGEITFYEMEKRYVRKDRQITWVHITVSLVRDRNTNHPLYFISAIEDINDRKGVERAHRESEERFRVLVEGIHDYALFVIDVHGIITSWNPGVRRLLGWAENEIVGKHVRIIYTQEDQAAGIPEHEMSQAAYTGASSDERWHVRKDGTRFYATGVVNPIYDETGRIRGFTKVLGDITERKQFVDKLTDAYDEQRRISEALQKSLLMTPPPDLYPGLIVKPLYQAAYEDVLIGGDFFDIYAVGENKMAIVVGDATGKGLDAAIYTAEIKFVLRAFLREYHSPSIALQRINAFVIDKEHLDIPSGHNPVYIALAIAILDTRDGYINTSIAGMEYPMIVRQDGTVVNMVNGGPLLGASHDTAYYESHEWLSMGDIFVMTTDGLTEARDAANRRVFFGSERLTSIAISEFQKTHSLSNAGLAILNAAREFSGGIISDDICLVLAMRRSLQ